MIHFEHDGKDWDRHEPSPAVSDGTRDNKRRLRGALSFGRGTAGGAHIRDFSFTEDSSRQSGLLHGLSCSYETSHNRRIKPYHRGRYLIYMFFLLFFLFFIFIFQCKPMKSEQNGFVGPVVL
ncbi:hypothetical protein NL108_017373 [Boleophthalmus pectinirostris]|nr:hypothetical protein NL108_017373 [Boleophthalmus pectinirostris]